VSAHPEDARLVRLPAGSFYGRSVQNRDVGGLILGERAYGAGLRTPRHAHEDDFFFLVLQGALTETGAGTPCDMGPATLAFQPSGQIHADHWPSPGGRCFHIELTRPWRDRLRQWSGHLASPHCFRNGMPVWLGLRIYREFTHMDTVSPLVIEALTLELVAEISRRRNATRLTGAPAWLRRIQEFLHARFSEPLTLAELAQSEAVHPVSLATAFRKHFGCTVGDYLRRRRVEFACQRLSQSPAPIVEISLEAGFAHQSHFNRTFKRLTGTTPAAYRNTFRGQA